MPVYVLALLCVVALGAFVAWRVRGARAVIDPDKLAAAETAMWQAYYAKDISALKQEICRMMEEQFGLGTMDARAVANDLAGAAIQFAFRGGGDGVSGQLESAYKRLGQATGLRFDPAEAARAELAWWTARRTPGQDSPDEVGRRIARFYAVLYGEMRPGFAQAGLLRAQAARLRDQGGAHADWPEVQRLLQQSYRALAGSL
jgi:hypothetical protein